MQIGYTVDSQPYVICHKIYAKSHICSFYFKNPLGVKESLLMSKVWKCIKQAGWEVDWQRVGEPGTGQRAGTDVPVPPAARSLPHPPG